MNCILNNVYFTSHVLVDVNVDRMRERERIHRGKGHRLERADDDQSI